MVKKSKSYGATIKLGGAAAPLSAANAQTL